MKIEFLLTFLSGLLISAHCLGQKASENFESLVSFSALGWHNPMTSEQLQQKSSTGFMTYYTFGKGSHATLSQSINILQEGEIFEISGEKLHPIKLGMPEIGSRCKFESIDQDFRLSSAGIILLVGDTLIVQNVAWNSQPIKVGTAVIRNNGIELISFEIDTNPPITAFTDSLYLSIFQKTFANDGASPEKVNIVPLVTFGNGKVLSVSEFNSHYAKTNSPYVEDSLRDFLQLVINFKIKVFDAELSARDTSLESQNELVEYALKSSKESLEKNPSWTRDSLLNRIEEIEFLAKKYHEGILLFNVTSENVWEKSVENETGLERYFEQNKSKYLGDLNSSKGRVIADYQLFLEDEWVANLRAKYNPIIIESNLESLIRK